MDNPEKLRSYKIQRTYIRNPKYTLTLYIPPVETTIIQNGYNVSPNGILYFQLPWKDTSVKRSIEIRVKNQRKILRCISTALGWFDSIPDLFVTKDDKLFFNREYDSLASKYKSDPLDNPQGMKIVPVAIECGNGVYEEGVILSINSIDNFIELTRNELQDLFDVLVNFNFSSEMQVTYQALILSQITGKIGTPNQNYTNRFLSQ